jgi:hypothetical protein
MTQQLLHGLLFLKHWDTQLIIWLLLAGAAAVLMVVVVVVPVDM